MVKKTSLLDYINESLLDDEDVLMKDTSNEVIKNEILKFLKENYFRSAKFKISKKPINGKYIVDCTTSLEVENRNITSLTNKYFVFGVVNGYFYCSFCDPLTSLEGAPKKVDGNFNCIRCDSLTSLKGAPKEVGGSFSCSYCNSLTSLKGAPKEVGGSFYCFNCNSLTSLEDAPKKVGRDFKCYDCKSLTSLKGAPEKVGRDFNCRNCKIQFTVDDVKKVSKVKGEIFY